MIRAWWAEGISGLQAMTIDNDSTVPQQPCSKDSGHCSNVTS